MGSVAPILQIFSDIQFLGSKLDFKIGKSLSKITNFPVLHVYKNDPISTYEPSLFSVWVNKYAKNVKNQKKLKLLSLTAVFLCFKDVILKLTSKPSIAIRRPNSVKKSAFQAHHWQINIIVGQKYFIFMRNQLLGPEIVSLQVLNTFIADRQLHFGFKVAEIRKTEITVIVVRNKCYRDGVGAFHVKHFFQTVSNFFRQNLVGIFSLTKLI